MWVRCNPNPMGRQTGDCVVRTMTVAELIAALEEFDEDTPVILSHDSGYTYGGIRYDLMEEEDEDDE